MRIVSLTMQYENVKLLEHVESIIKCEADETLAPDECRCEIV